MIHAERYLSIHLRLRSPWVQLRGSQTPSPESPASVFSANDCDFFGDGDLLLRLVCLNFLCGSFVFQMQYKLGLHEASVFTLCSVLWPVPSLYLPYPLYRSSGRGGGLLRRDQIGKGLSQVADTN